MNIKQQMIEALKHSIEHAQSRIKELTELCVKSYAQSRTAEREFWKKKLKGYKKELKRLKDDSLGAVR